MNYTILLYYFTFQFMLSITIGGQLQWRDEGVAVRNQRCRWKHNFLHVLPNGSESCLPCKLCPAGKGMTQKCTRQTDTICEDCPIGTFSPEGAKHCHRCFKTCPAGAEMLQNCTPTSNIKCGQCVNGTYSHRNSSCVPCKKVCPPGTYVKHKCTAKKDTICSPCPRGTYFNEPNVNNFCESCHFCGYGRKTLQLCTRKNDSVCGGCKEGFFYNPVSIQCEKCSDCFPGLESIQKKSCRMNNSNYLRPCLVRPDTTGNSLTVTITVTSSQIQTDDKAALVKLEIGISFGILLFLTFVIVMIIFKTRLHTTKRLKNDFKEIETCDHAIVETKQRISYPLTAFSTSGKNEDTVYRMSNSVPCSKSPLDVSIVRYSYPTNAYNIIENSRPISYTSSESQASHVNMILSVSMARLNERPICDKAIQDSTDSEHLSTNPSFVDENSDHMVAHDHNGLSKFIT